jgi:hypothetical protein
MRSFSIVIVLLVLGFKLSAQNNLQFNQVKLVGSTAETVPGGKVWKIESAPISVKDGIQAIPRFLMGTDTILLGCCESYSTSQLENVVSVKLEYNGSNTGGISTTPTTYFSINGASNVNILLNGNKKPGQPFSQTLSYSNVPSGETESNISLGSRIVSNSGSNQINSFTINFSVLPVFVSNVNNYYANWYYNFLVTFYLANGNSFSYPVLSFYNIASSVSSGIWPQSINGPTIPSETRDRKVSTQFPIWIPAGTAVKTLSNIGKLSILEFNVTQ